MTWVLFSQRWNLIDPSRERERFDRLASCNNCVYIDLHMSVMASVRGVGAGATAPSASVFFVGGSGGSVLIRTIKRPAQHTGDEEEDAVNDGEDPRSLEHGTWLIDVVSEVAATRVVLVANLHTDWNRQISTIGV